MGLDTCMQRHPKAIEYSQDNEALLTLFDRILYIFFLSLILKTLLKEMSEKSFKSSTARLHGRRHSQLAIYDFSVNK